MSINNNNDILESYKDLSPLDLVNFLESNFTLFLNKFPSINNLNQISQYKSSNQLHFKILDFIKNPNNIQNIFNSTNNNRQITIIKIFANYIFVGDNLGYVQIFSLKTGKVLRNFINQENIINTSVTHIEIFSDHEIIIVGYSNGYITIYDLNSQKNIYTIKNIFNGEILCIHIVNIIPKKSYDFIASDNKGLVNRLLITEGFFKKNLQVNEIYINENFPTYLIQSFKPYVDKNYVIFTFANKNEIKLYLFSPIFKYICSFYKNLDFVDYKNFSLPDVDIGYGNLENISKKNDNNNINKTTEKIILDEGRKYEIILAISWDKIIRFYYIVFEEDEFNNLMVNINSESCFSHFVNSTSIIRIGFISPSILYFFDKNYELSVIYTVFTKKGDFINNNNNFDITEKALIDKGKVIDKNILKKVIISEGNKENFCYRNFIFTYNKNIYILSKENLFIGKMLNYEECINELINKNNNWLDALYLSIDIYQGNFIPFPDISYNKNKRKITVLPVLKNVIIKYINFYLKEYDNNNANNFDLDKYIYITIEYCIIIKIFNFLITDIYPIFFEKNLQDKLITDIEPFIFNDFIKKEDITSILPMYYNIYINNNNLFSQLLTHLNINTLNNNSIKNLIISYDLFTIMIKLFSNCSNFQDQFLPIIKMTKYIFNINNKQNEETLNYIEIYKKKGINYLMNTTYYIYHKLFWYIDLILKGKKFCNNNYENENFIIFDQESTDYKNLISMIFIFLLQKIIFEKFILIDSYTYFNILKNFYINEVISQIIKNMDFEILITNYINIINKINTNYKEKDSVIIIDEIEKIKYNKHSETLSHIIKLMNNNVYNLFINQDYNMFILYVTNKIPKMFPHKNVLSALEYVINFFNKYQNNNDKDCIDYFNYYNNPNDIKNNKYHKEIYNIFNKIIKCGFVINNTDCKSLIKIIDEIDYYNNLKLKIYQILKKYKECIELILNNNKNEIFDFLSETFELFNNDTKNYNYIDYVNLQNNIIEKILILNDLNENKTFKIVDDWFENEYKIKIVYKFENNNEIQFKYLEKILNSAENNNFENEIYILYINILKNLNKNNLIYKFIKKFPNKFSLNETINNLNNNIDFKDKINCIAFLYEYNKKYKEAINIAQDNLENKYNLLINENFNDNNLNNFFDSFNLCMNIYENVSDYIKNNNNNNIDIEINNLWLNIFDKFYNYYINNENNNNLNNYLKKCSKKILRKMCIFINIQVIFEFFLKKFNDMDLNKFKEIFFPMFYSMNNYCKILKNSKKIYNNFIIQLNKISIYNNFKGNGFIDSKCNLCNKIYYVNNFEKYEYNLNDEDKSFNNYYINTIENNIANDDENYIENNYKSMNENNNDIETKEKEENTNNNEKFNNNINEEVLKKEIQNENNNENINIESKEENSENINEKKEDKIDIHIENDNNNDDNNNLKQKNDNENNKNEIKNINDNSYTINNKEEDNSINEKNDKKLENENNKIDKNIEANNDESNENNNNKINIIKEDNLKENNNNNNEIIENFEENNKNLNNNFIEISKKNKNDKIYFNCGHKYHIKCCLKTQNEKYYCKLCNDIQISDDYKNVIITNNINKNQITFDYIKNKLNNFDNKFYKNKI